MDHVFLVARWPMYQTGKVINGRLAADTHFISDMQEPSETPEASAQVLNRSLPRTVDFLTSLGIATTIVLPTPVWPRMREQFTPQNQSLSKDEYMSQRDSADKLLSTIARHKLVTLLEPADLLCPQTDCQLFEDGEPLYIDHNHLSPKGARKLSPLIESSLAQD